MIRSHPVKCLRLQDLINVRQFTDTLSLSSVPVTSLFIQITVLSEGFDTIYSLAEEAPSIKPLIIVAPIPRLQIIGGSTTGTIEAGDFDDPEYSDSTFQGTVRMWDISEWTPGGLEQIMVQTSDQALTTFGMLMTWNHLLGILVIGRVRLRK